MPYSGLKALRMPLTPWLYCEVVTFRAMVAPFLSAVVRRSGRKLLAQLGPSRSAPLLAVKFPQTKDAKGSP